MGQPGRRPGGPVVTGGEEQPVTPPDDVPEHPGTIVFEQVVLRDPPDRPEETTWTQPAADVPFAIRFIRGPGGWVPVVRIVAVTAGDRRTIRQYGPDGQLLQSTVQLRAP